MISFNSLIMAEIIEAWENRHEEFVKELYDYCLIEIMRKKPYTYSKCEIFLGDGAPDEEWPQAVVKEVKDKLIDLGLVVNYVVDNKIIDIDYIDYPKEHWRTKLCPGHLVARLPKCEDSPQEIY